jgi:hypothetical protein
MPRVQFEKKPIHNEKLETYDEVEDLVYNMENSLRDIVAQIEDRQHAQARVDLDAFAQDYARISAYVNERLEEDSPTNG